MTNSAHYPPPARAYAAYFAARLRHAAGDAGTAQAAIAKLGFATDWLVVGPFDNEGKTGLRFPNEPESQLTEPIIEGRAFSGKERAVRWRTAPAVFGMGVLTGDSLFRPQQHICFYASTFLQNGHQRLTTGSLWLGAAGAVRAWLNGVPILEDPAYRGHDVDRWGVLVQIPAGVSRLTVKTCGAVDAPSLSVRVADARGAADPDLSWSADLVEGTRSPSNAGSGGVLRTNLGPLAAFEHALDANPADADKQEAYARYLLQTNGDDASIHRARDLAKRAAEMSPTVKRLLFAGVTAEDYNLERVWINKAIALRGDKPQGVELLLAQARLELSGLNDADALPYYEKVLKLEPDNLEALNGIVSQYNSVGLPHTALGLVERATQQNPTSISHLALLVAQLQQAGAHFRADTTRDRYEALQFFGAGELSEQLSVALARHERAKAEHWTARLLELHPEKLWTYSTVATAYRQLGQPERAVATYQKALTLAPEDVTLLRALSDLQGQLGKRDRQIQLLRQILELRPQQTEIQRYADFLDPQAEKPDEALAWSSDDFLPFRDAPADGEGKRTLLDLTVNTVFENGLSSEFRQVVYQPLVESAAALAQHYSFAYQADTQRVELRSAKVYRTNGRVDEAIETGIGAANNPSIAMYTSARTYNIELPRLEAGDVVELRYRIDDFTPRNEYDDYFGTVRYLQDSEPVRHAEYVLVTPKQRKFKVDTQRIPGLHQKIFVEGDQRTYRFWAKDLEPIVPEPAMPPFSEVLGFIHVSTYDNYKDLGAWYWGLAKDQFDLDDETRKLAHELADRLPEERDKVAAIYNWVIKNTRYVALEFGIYGHKPRRCVQTVARGWGDCKDKATVIVSLLKELGIKSTIVILRTQQRGNFKSKVASLSPFDHAIAYVPSLDLYLDGTAEFTGYTELPSMDRGALGVLVNEGNAKLVQLPFKTATADRQRRDAVFRLKRDGAARAEFEFVTSGVSAAAWRRRYQAKATQRERVIEDLSGEFPGLRLDPGTNGLNIRANDLSTPVTIGIKASVPQLARPVNGGLSMNVTLNQNLTQRFASLSTRKLDVRLPIMGIQERNTEVILPRGYTVISKPDNIEVKSKFGTYRVELSQEGSRVTAYSSLSIRQTRIVPKDYGQWRAFAQAADAAMNPRLVVGVKQ